MPRPASSRRVGFRRRPTGWQVSASLLLLAVAACGSHTADGRPAGSPPAGKPAADHPAASSPASHVASTPRPPEPQLPRGGTTIFPANLVVMHYGTAGSGVLGILGDGAPEQAADRLEAAAAPYVAASGRPVLPAFELITTVASSRPGTDGTYSSELPAAEVQRYLAVARAHRMLLVLDFQPGRAEFLDQVREYAQFLSQPDVGVALDPEWKLTATQRPLQQVGTSAAAPINAVSAYLSGIVERDRLPEKIFMVHQFKAYELPDRSSVVDQPGLATVLHVDGFGAQPDKIKTYLALASRTPRLVNGFKLFYKADTGLMTPTQAMALVPRPELISYQ